jgi:FMN phosphatase YigB (HAD superfamily)
MTKSPYEVVFFDLGDTLVDGKTTGYLGTGRTWRTRSFASEGIAVGINIYQESRDDNKLYYDSKLDGVCYPAFIHQSARSAWRTNTGNLTRLQLVAMLPPDFDLAQFEDHLIVCSSEVGVEKPGLEIFRLALARASVEARKCLFCTEELLHTLAAQQVGMHVARLQTPPRSDVGSVPDLLKQLNRLI